MAFTDEQKLNIVKILSDWGVTPRMLDSQIEFLGSDLTAAKETAVIAEITRWTTGGAGSSFIRIYPKESNFGTEVNAGNAKSDIKQNIAALLELTHLIPSGVGTIQICS